MSKLLNYLKYFGIFFLVIITIAIITSLINLTGINSSTINKLSIVITAISFFVIAALASHKTKERGFIIGLKLSISFVLLLLIINLIVFRSSFNIDRLIYYTILILSGILGGAFGKNIKKKA